jgi:uncharacterized protein YjbI with pentapeptide repeats
MGAGFHSCWQKIKQHPVPTVSIALFVALSVLVIFGGYKFNWDWTGFNRPSKTLWDWLQLLAVLAVPIVVGIGAVWFTTRQGKVADEENKDNQRETALQGYIDKMSELLLHEKLRDSAEEDEVRRVARVRTMTVLPRLDGKRKGTVLQFLYESGLIHKNKTIIDLHGADLSNVDLTYVNLSEACLRRTNMQKAHFLGANLQGVDFTLTNLSHADLTLTTMDDADLRGAILISANFNATHLRGAILNYADLSSANLEGIRGVNIKELEKQANLQGINMP